MPDVITRRFRLPPYDGTPHDFYVYTQEEADEEGITYNPRWWMAEPGEWVLTTDGYVGQIIRRRDMSLRDRPHILSLELTFTFARKIIKLNKATMGQDSHQRLEYEPYRKLEGSYHLTRAMKWDEDEARRTRTKRAVTVFAQRTIAREGKRLKPEDWQKVGEAYRPDTEIPQATAKRLFNSALIRDMAQKRIKDILRASGVDMGTVVDAYVKAVQIAEEDRRPKEMLEGTDRLHQLVREGESASADDHNIDWGDVDDAKVKAVFAKPDRPQLAQPEKEAVEAENEEKQAESA